MKRVDALGDPLPPGALARLGTLRLWQGGTLGSLAFSRDGKMLASGGMWQSSRPSMGGGRGASGSQTIWLWDVRDGRPIRNITSPTNIISGLAFSPGGRRLAAAAFGGVHVFDTATGKELMQSRELTVQFIMANTLPFISFAKDGKNLAAGAPEKVVFLDATSGKKWKELRRPAAPETEKAHAVAMSADWKRLAWVSEVDLPKNQKKYFITLCETGAGKPLKRWEHREKNAFHNPALPVLSADGSRLAFGTILWDTLKAAKLLEIEPRGQEWLFTPDGKRLVGILHDSIESYDTVSGKLERAVQLDPRPPQGDGFGHNHPRAFTADGKTLALGPAAIQLVNLESGKDSLPIPRMLGKVSYLEFTPDGRTLYSGDPSVFTPFELADLRPWDVSTWKSRPAVTRTILNKFRNRVLALSPPNKLLATKDLKLLDLSSGKEISALGKNPDYNSGQFSPDGKLLAAYLANARRFEFFDTASGKKLGQMPAEFGHFGNFGDAKFSADGKLLAWADAPKQVVLVGDVAAGKLLWRLGDKPGEKAGQQGQPRQPSNRSPCFTFSPDSKYLAWAPADVNALEIVDLKTGHPVGRVQVPLDGLSVAVFTGVVFSRDNRMLAVGLDGDPHVQVFELVSGRERARLSGHRDGIASLAFSLDGRFLASGSADTSILIWNMRDPLGKTRPAELSARQLDERWSTLADPDPVRAYDALLDLVHAPAASVPFLDRALHAAPAVETATVIKLIAELDSPRFNIREKATSELEKLTDLSEPFLRKALAGSSSLEMRRRLEKLLKQAQVPAGARLRELRALEVLENIASTSVRQVLHRLAQGNPHARLTRQTRETLERLRFGD